MKLLKVTNKEIILETGEIIKINRDIYYRFHLKDKTEIIDQDLKEIFFEIIYNRAILILSKGDNTEAVLKRKLISKFGKKDEIEGVISKVKEKMYINDFNYGVNFIQRKKFGNRRIKYELIKLGINEETISEILEKTEIDEIEFLKYHLRKVKKKEKEKIIRNLISKGFEYEDINKELENLI